MKKYFTNFNYEAQLQNKVRSTTLSQKEINRNYEFVYFFMEKEPSILINQNEYSQEYLEHISSLVLIVPRFQTIDDDVSFWWGRLEDFELERKLNSKITSTKLAQRLKMCSAETELIFSEKELQQYINRNSSCKDFFIRLPFSVSGQGCFRYQKGSKVSKRVKFDEGIIIEPYFQNVENFGCYISPTGEFVRWKNFITNNGRYIGGRILDGGKPLTDYKAEMMIVLNEYMNLGAKEAIQVDSFSYEDKGVLKWYPLCEVNYRKTMGMFLVSLIDFSHKGKVSLLIDKKKSKWDGENLFNIKQKISDISYNQDNKKGVLLLSPDNIDRLAFAIIDYSDKEEQTILEHLNQEFFS
ncbi:MAG: hypothetical protein ACO2ZP_07635 [Bacteriovoracaceae bacterium]